MNRRLAWNGLLLVAALAALAVAWWIYDHDPAPTREGPEAVRGEGKEAAADEGARLVGTPVGSGAAGKAGEPAAGGAADRLVTRLHGVVVEGEGRPRAGVAVRFEIGQRPAARATTDAEGRFALRVELPPGVGPLYGLLAARDIAGIGLRSVELRPDPRWPHPTIRARRWFSRRPPSGPAPALSTSLDRWSAERRIPIPSREGKSQCRCSGSWH